MHTAHVYNQDLYKAWKLIGAPAHSPNCRLRAEEKKAGYLVRFAWKPGESAYMRGWHTHLGV